MTDYNGYIIILALIIFCISCIITMIRSIIHLFNKKTITTEIYNVTDTNYNVTDSGVKK